MIQIIVYDKEADPKACYPGLYLTQSLGHKKELMVKMHHAEGAEPEWINLEGTRGFNIPEHCWTTAIVRDIEPKK